LTHTASPLLEGGGHAFPQAPQLLADVDVSTHPWPAPQNDASLQSPAASADPEPLASTPPAASSLVGAEPSPPASQQVQFASEPDPSVTVLPSSTMTLASLQRFTSPQVSGTTSQPSATTVTMTTGTTAIFLTLIVILKGLVLSRGPLKSGLEKRILHRPA
jgi:hypothetical protein